jgi:hypothetical protein
MILTQQPLYAANTPDPFGVSNCDATRVLCKEGETARHQLDHVHLVISLLKRWLVGTHQGAVTPEHLQAYLDEFAFRFNRRLSTHRGKLFQRLIQQSVTSRPPAVNAFYSKKPQHMGVA